MSWMLVEHNTHIGLRLLDSPFRFFIVGGHTVVLGPKDKPVTDIISEDTIKKFRQKVKLMEQLDIHFQLD